MNTSIQDEIRRGNREIAQIEVALLAGHPDVAGLCLALSDWRTEIRILNAELVGRQDAAEDKNSRRPEGQRPGRIGPLLPERVDPFPGVGLRIRPDRPAECSRRRGPAGADYAGISSG
jgi:hypothetical protein